MEPKCLAISVLKVRVVYNYYYHQPITRMHSDA